MSKPTHEPPFVPCDCPHGSYMISCPNKAHYLAKDIDSGLHFYLCKDCLRRGQYKIIEELK